MTECCFYLYLILKTTRNMTQRFLTFICLILCVAAKGWTQPQDTTDRTTIGLVLSGGGAKGLAHIGVLKVLEEEGIYPDYITGTSMGSIIGGLYAIGYTADDLSEINKTADWETLLSDEISADRIVMEEKYEYNRYLFEIPYRNKQLTLPSGLIEGQQLENYFSDLTWRTAGIADFNNYPYPFHCMAVDIVKGQPIEFQHGDLGNAMRASMAIPSVFAPVRKDSMLLVDGGVIRNFPVEEAKAMGADIIIGVYVGFEENITAEQLHSLSDVLTRTTVFYGIFDSQQQINKTDILITPDLNGMGAADFSKGGIIEKYGYQAADSLRQQLRELKKQHKLSKQPPKSLNEQEILYISDIETNNLHYVDEEFVIGKGGIYPGMWVSKKELSEAVETIFGTRYFDKITYRLEKISDNGYRLTYNIKESNRALLKVALHYDNEQGAGLVLNATARNYLIPSSRLLLTSYISENPGIRLQINNYIGKRQRLMDYYYIDWRRMTIPVFFDDKRLGESRNGHLKAGIAGKYAYTTNQQVGLGAFYQINQIFPGDAVKTFFEEADFNKYGYGSFGFDAFYHQNNLDHAFFPTRGSKIDIYYKRILDPQLKGSLDHDKTIEDRAFTQDLKPFSLFHLNYDQYISPFDFVTLNGGVYLGLTGKDAIFTESFILGGIIEDRRINMQPFAGFGFAELIVPNYFRVHAGFDIPIVSRVYFSTKINAGLFPETPSETLDQIAHYGINDYVKGFNAGVRINSRLGPIELITGANEKASGLKWLVNIGFNF